MEMAKRQRIKDSAVLIRMSKTFKQNLKILANSMNMNLTKYIEYKLQA